MLYLFYMFCCCYLKYILSKLRILCTIVKIYWFASKECILFCDLNPPFSFSKNSPGANLHRELKEAHQEIA